MAKRLEGLQTIRSIATTLNVGRRTAINYIWKLRKNGLVETSYQKRKIRMYKISPTKKQEIGYPGLYDIINSYSKVKVVVGYEHKMHDHKMSIEEAIVRAVELKRFRTLLAALGLFNKVKNWNSLYKIAKKQKIGRNLGALYDTARQTMKVRKMDKRTRSALLKTEVLDKYIIPGLKTRDFRDVEKEWGVYIPFNKADLEVYKE